jgi:hypothetical protein
MDLFQKRYLLTDLRYNRKSDDFDSTSEWSVYLIHADYDVLEPKKGSGFVPKFVKDPDGFLVKKLLIGPKNLAASNLQFAGQYFKGSTFPLDQKRRMIATIFKKVRPD